MSAPVSDAMLGEITRRLHAVEAEGDCTILLAVESGSRAWGFHSPDSDYDVRFVYARPLDWHLTIEPGRDVIERPIVDEIDLSGWELRKALGLVLRSNAVVLEWLRSPIRYAETTDFAGDLSRFAASVLDRRALRWHYSRLAERQHTRLRDEAGRIRLKTYPYVVRPALALRWLRLRSDGPPPMDMGRLVSETGLPTDALRELEILIRTKRTLAESGTAPAPPPALDALVTEELRMTAEALSVEGPRHGAKDAASADRLLAAWTRRAAGIAA